VEQWVGQTWRFIPMPGADIWSDASYTGTPFKYCSVNNLTSFSYDFRVRSVIDTPTQIFKYYCETAGLTFDLWTTQTKCLKLM
jgi:hypothetical protein